jgi:hypothetical protein
MNETANEVMVGGAGRDGASKTFSVRDIVNEALSATLQDVATSRRSVSRDARGNHQDAARCRHEQAVGAQ